MPSINKIYSELNSPSNSIFKQKSFSFKVCIIEDKKKRVLHFIFLNSIFNKNEILKYIFISCITNKGLSIEKLGILKIFSSNKMNFNKIIIVVNIERLLVEQCMQDVTKGFKNKQIAIIKEGELIGVQKRVKSKNTFDN